ncbi:TRAP transporter large permease [Bacillus sp. DTU_2020_1000418_1_SI_GHA_SEK_038]|uniref:TRAP transporter large permease n=1 Tax=Bacillus sp. DTU_2020_1000418_1_SI_GHA_SEK_038 TaxID=3077585 RepID=UPI0028EDA0C6|nr:TRAP transporter large permease [Bacillus sp. DTU_2020_1000418_1_SI_GHA_SEK_038]WNS73693.1 TRAP transporter large permease [Bacillus sp. DTU_2020_1000418_1_SI_GHA_SEK_038]
MIVTLFVVLFVLLLSSAPVYIALSLASVIALYFFTALPMEVIPQRMYAGIDKFSLMAIPFFILAANVMQSGGLSSRILRLANALVGHLRGGLAISVVIASMFFGAVSGSSPATVVAIGGLMLPALMKAGYHEKFSTGLITSTSAVAVIIPPSIGLIVYGAVTGTSVGDLFIAGIFPGIVFGLIFIGYSYYYARKNQIPVNAAASKNELFSAFKNAIWALGIPIVIVVGIYGGIFTPTESAAVASIYAIFIALFVYKDLDFKGLMRAAIESGIGTAQIMILLASASIFAWLLTRFQVPQGLAELMVSISDSKIAILLMMNLIMLIAGMFIDSASFTIILAPLFLPIALHFGIDPVHLGVIMILNGAIGMFTPPFGLNLFVASGISKVPVARIISGVIPFIILSLITLLLVTYIEQITMFLPNFLK